MCHCPVSCEFRSYETEISYGSTQMNAMKQLVNDNDSKKLSTARLAAMEVTSRMKNATLQRKVSLGYRFIHSLADIEEVLLVNLSNKVDEISNVLTDDIINTQNLFNVKTFLYNFQIHIVQKNFIGAKDAMEDRTIQDVVLAYLDFIMDVEKSIRLLTDRNLTDPSVRLMMHRSTSLMLTAKIEMIQRAFVNYTTLKRAYDTGTPIFNYSFRNLPWEFNKPATPKYLLMHASVHNNYSRVYGKRLFAELDNLRLVLKTLLNLTNEAHATGFIDNDDLVRQRERFQTHMRRFLFARSVFNIDTVEWPLGILQTRLHSFHTMWHHYSEVVMHINERLHAMQVELRKIKTSFFLPLANIKRKMNNLIFFQNETQISISELLTSDRIKEGIYYFKTYFQRLITTGVVLTDWIQHTEKEVLEIWKKVVEDKDSTEYHSYMNQYQFTRGFSDIKREILSNFTYLEHLCHFHTIIANKELLFINTLTKLIDEAKAYKEFATIDSEFVR
ncbi:hypothetical protein KP79_PYT13307 [Mizuhopecten yessoensis]|uniref:Uncharacterized protein n=1 Tax=Mizuhopecten yessoensis TaxID=6573 RepID=A0A210PT49_MIZYE|nr:hypothetical protein KP79_PYT13307 [Mizuhopecten yessoensis]